MSDMSFKQAKELVERLELSELTLNKTANDIDESSKKFNESLKKQEYVLSLLPKADKKLNILRLLVTLNIGFILGLIVGATMMK